MKLLLLIFAILFSIAAANDDDRKLESLHPDVFRNEVLRRELALQGSKNAEDSTSRRLLQAAVFYYDKKWDSAYAAYKPFLESASDLLYGPMILRLAKCEMERGNYQESRKLLLNLKSLKNNKNSWERADQILLEGVLRDTSITPKAKKDSIEKRLKLKPNTNYAQYLRWTLGTTESYFSALRNGGRFADSAFKALQTLAPTSTDYDFVRFTCKKGYHERCADRINTILSSKNANIGNDRKLNLMVMQAEAWRLSGKTDLAIARYKKLLDSIDHNVTWMQTLLRMYRTAGNNVEARKLDSIFRKKFPASTENANNLWVKGMEYEQAKEYEKAIEVYKQLYSGSFEKNQRKQWAKFRVGFISFKEGNYSKAAPIFAEAAKDNTGPMPRSAALYFYAECQRLLEKKENATTAYKAVIADFPLGYYAWRAKQNLKEFGLAETTPKLCAKMSEDSTTLWLRGLRKREENTKDSLVSVKRLEQIEMLLRSGFEEEAFVLYDETLKLHKNRPEFYYRYGMMFMQNGEHALAHRMAHVFLNMVPRQKMENIPIQVMKFLYPLPYEDKVRKHAKIDPLLVYSVMRHESMFDAKIQSPVGARGLLQIMPTTGEFLAKREGVQNYDKDLLYNAYFNIRLGVRYLNDLYVEHNQDYIGVLGEYNAGPAPANRWIASHGSLPWDIRVEEVSYWETRDYIKRVVGSYWTYKEIYGSD
ncbi:MAG: transglycosylase SLT domain-containing protein [Fibromonadales bacterium]|nr:transglycosylase SLT domain-containing protein [Fibromonadales bacterium]